MVLDRWESFAAWILLAHNEGPRNGTCKEKKRLLVLPEANDEARQSFRPIDISWPFTVWGIDIVDILPRVPGGFRNLLIGIDTSTKWMEAMPAVNVTQDAPVKFL
jgi:hypothetical protein